MVGGGDLRKSRAWPLPSGAMEDSFGSQDRTEQAVSTQYHLNVPIVSIKGASEMTSYKKWFLFEL